jgi:hypothetical protein
MPATEVTMRRPITSTKSTHPSKKARDAENQTRDATTVCHRAHHLKNERFMDGHYLADRDVDANNAILAAVGYNFRCLIRWLRILWRLILEVPFATSKPMLE